MYSIFILAENIDNFDFDNIPTEYELFEYLSYSGVDHIYGDTNLDDDVEWCFKNVYNLKKIEKIDGIYKIDKQELIEALKKEKRYKLENVKKLIKDMEHDIMSVPAWNIAHEIYTKKGFFFYAKGFGIMNEMDMLDDYLQSLKDDNIYILKSFDYHF